MTSTNAKFIGLLKTLKLRWCETDNKFDQIFGDNILCDAWSECDYTKTAYGPSRPTIDALSHFSVSREYSQLHLIHAGVLWHAARHHVMEN